MSAVGRHHENIRVVAVWCPDWPAIAAARAESIGVEQPLAVLRGGAVMACNAPARAAGVRRGVRRRDAQFRCPELIVREVDPGRDTAEFEPVARALDGVVAGTELLRPGLVVLSAPGALRYYGGVDELDVNEQNPGAVEFYRRRGFEQVGRSPVDSDGRPFPLLHFRRAGVP